MAISLCWSEKGRVLSREPAVFVPSKAFSILYKNQSGKLVVLLALTPLLLSLLSVVASTGILLTRHQSLQTECLQAVNAVQQKFRRLANRLEELNQTSFRLRKKRKQAEKLLKAARVTKHPAAIAAAEVRRAKVVADQVRHRYRIQKIFRKTQRLHRSFPHQEAVIRKSDSRFRKAFIQAEGGRFSFVPYPPASLTPNYKPFWNFSSQQTTSVKWGIAVQQSLPRWLFALLKTPQKLIEGSCSATIRKGKRKWRVYLTEDK